MYEGELQRHDIKTDLSVTEEYKEDRIDYVYLDPTRLTQVLINLLSNAIKFTQPRNYRHISIKIRSSTDPPLGSRFGGSWFERRSHAGEWSADAVDTPHPSFGEPIFLQFLVSDSGCGVSAAEIESLSQRFSQATPRTHIRYGGSGLVLFISRELVEMQGGQIGVASTIDVGSTFSFYIKAWRYKPTLSRPPTFIQSIVLLFGTAPLEPVVVPSLEMPKLPEQLHMLVVEDNLINQRVMATQLRRVGCIVYVANHGQEALDILEKSTFWAASRLETSVMGGIAETSQRDTERQAMELHVILMDVEMPTMDGLTCVREIRKLQAEDRVLGHVPVIAVTANARDAQKAEAIEMGMVGSAYISQQGSRVLTVY